MLDTRDPPLALGTAETKMLAAAYGYALSYFDLAPLDADERRHLARLTIVAGRARRRLRKRLVSSVDAHALAAEIIELFHLIRQL